MKYLHCNEKKGKIDYKITYL